MGGVQGEEIEASPSRTLGQAEEDQESRGLEEENGGLEGTKALEGRNKDPDVQVGLGQGSERDIRDDGILEHRVGSPEKDDCYELHRDGEYDRKKWARGEGRESHDTGFLSGVTSTLERETPQDGSILHVVDPSTRLPNEEDQDQGDKDARHLNLEPRMQVLGHQVDHGDEIHRGQRDQPSLGVDADVILGNPSEMKMSSEESRSHDGPPRANDGEEGSGPVDEDTPLSLQRNTDTDDIDKDEDYRGDDERDDERDDVYVWGRLSHQNSKTGLMVPENVKVMDDYAIRSVRSADDEVKDDADQRGFYRPVLGRRSQEIGVESKETSSDTQNDGKSKIDEVLGNTNTENALNVEVVKREPNNEGIPSGDPQQQDHEAGEIREDDTGHGSSTLTLEVREDYDRNMQGLSSRYTEEVENHHVLPMSVGRSSPEARNKVDVSGERTGGNQFPDHVDRRGESKPEVSHGPSGSKFGLLHSEERSIPSIRYSEDSPVWHGEKIFKGQEGNVSYPKFYDKKRCKGGAETIDGGALMEESDTVSRDQAQDTDTGVCDVVHISSSEGEDKPDNDNLRERHEMNMYREGKDMKQELVQIPGIENCNDPQYVQTPPTTNFWCKPCERYFVDENARRSHMRSRKHLLREQEEISRNRVQSGKTEEAQDFGCELEHVDHKEVHSFGYPSNESPEKLEVSKHRRKEFRILPTWPASLKEWIQNCYRKNVFPGRPNEDEMKRKVEEAMFRVINEKENDADGNMLYLTNWKHEPPIIMSNYDIDGGDDDLLDSLPGVDHNWGNQMDREREAYDSPEEDPSKRKLYSPRNEGSPIRTREARDRRKRKFYSGTMKPEIIAETRVEVPSKLSVPGFERYHREDLYDVTRSPHREDNHHEALRKFPRKQAFVSPREEADIHMRHHVRRPESFTVDDYGSTTYHRRPRLAPYEFDATEEPSNYPNDVGRRDPDQDHSRSNREGYRREVRQVSVVHPVGPMRNKGIPRQGRSQDLNPEELTERRLNDLWNHNHELREVDCHESYQELPRSYDEHRRFSVSFDEGFHDIDVNRGRPERANCINQCENKRHWVLDDAWEDGGRRETYEEFPEVRDGERNWTYHCDEAPLQRSLPRMLVEPGSDLPRPSEPRELTRRDELDLGPGIARRHPEYMDHDGSGLRERNGYRMTRIPTADEEYLLDDDPDRATRHRNGDPSHYPSRKVGPPILAVERGRHEFRDNTRIERGMDRRRLDREPSTLDDQSARYWGGMEERGRFADPRIILRAPYLEQDEVHPGFTAMDQRGGHRFGKYPDFPGRRPTGPGAFPRRSEQLSPGYDSIAPATRERQETRIRREPFETDRGDIRREAHLPGYHHHKAYQSFMTEDGDVLMGGPEPVRLCPDAPPLQRSWDSRAGDFRDAADFRSQKNPLVAKGHLEMMDAERGWARYDRGGSHNQGGPRMYDRGTSISDTLDSKREGNEWFSRRLRLQQTYAPQRG
uniref:C2H2-type domain-containing protein n=1 Tax=Compsopogon caeruleus TaxID=31354 RepID=A0A7S1T452_9RHOD